MWVISSKLIYSFMFYLAWLHRFMDLPEMLRNTQSSAGIAGLNLASGLDGEGIGVQLESETGTY